MGDLLTYSVEDFLPFVREAFLLLLSNYHAEFWPMSLGLVALSLGGLAITFWKSHYAARVLSLVWLWIGFVASGTRS